MITSLQLEHFKSFRDANVPFGPMTLVVGTNASGKSNLRDAFQFLHGCALGFTLTEVIDGKWGQGGIQQWRGLRGGVKEILHHGSQSMNLEIQLDRSRRLGYTYSLQVGETGIRRQPFRILGEQFHKREHFQLLEIFTAETKQLENSPELQTRFQAAVFNYQFNQSVLHQALEDRRIQDSSRNHVARVISEMRGMRFFDLSPRAIREATLPSQTVLGDHGENLSSVLLTICEDPARKSALLGWLRSLTPMDVRDLDFKEDLHGRVLVYLVESGGQMTSAYSASDGTLRFLALAAALLSPDSGHFYFFEEIDNGIHPTRLHLLLDVLEQASREMGCQIVATTHNPQLLAFLSKKSREDAVLLYRREGSPASEARRIMELPGIEEILETQNLSNLFASGWLEDAVEFAEDSPETETTVSATA